MYEGTNKFQTYSGNYIVHTREYRLPAQKEVVTQATQDRVFVTPKWLNVRINKDERRTITSVARVT